MIQCNKCGIIKESIEYRKSNINKSGKTGICKICKNTAERVQKKIYRSKPGMKAKRKEWWDKHYSNPENVKKHLDKNNEWKNKPENKNYYKEYSKKYLSDPLKWERVKEYKTERYQNNVEYRLICLTRGRIHQFLKNKDQIKNEETLKLLGCCPEDYKIYLEQQFDNNMNWDNQGTYWEIDHIIPLCSGGSFHYTNTRPLTVSENRKRLRPKTIK